MISRNDILEFTGCLINGSREQSYGHPDANEKLVNEMKDGSK